MCACGCKWSHVSLSYFSRQHFLNFHLKHKISMVKLSMKSKFSFKFSSAISQISIKILTILPGREVLYIFLGFRFLNNFCFFFFNFLFFFFFVFLYEKYFHKQFKLWQSVALANGVGAVVAVVVVVVVVELYSLPCKSSKFL